MVDHIRLLKLPRKHCSAHSGKCSNKFNSPLASLLIHSYSRSTNGGENEVLAATKPRRKPSRNSKVVSSSAPIQTVEEKTQTPRRKLAQSRQSTRKPVQTTKHEATSTTPAPPTTPDPGSDFKCEDEGFFPNPKDCKKYFWCLDSGPSNLGIVAHHFTCPSGLVFNKLTDSCDYSRNVVCTTTKTTTTTAA